MPEPQSYACAEPWKALTAFLGKSRLYNHPHADEGPFTSDIAVAETGLALKDEMQFTLAYADCWQFEVRLEAVNPEPCRLRRIEVIESTGKAPEQYPNADF